MASKSPTAKRMTAGVTEAAGPYTGSSEVADPEAALEAANEAAYARATGPRSGSDSGRMGMREQINSHRYRDERATTGLAGYVEPLERERRRRESEGQKPEESNGEAAFKRFAGDEGVDAAEVEDDGEGRPSQIERARETLRRTGMFSESTLAKMSRHDIKAAARKAERKALAQERRRESRGREAGHDPEQNGRQETLPSNERAPQSQVPARKFDLSKLDAHFEAFDDSSKAALKAAMRDVVSHFEASGEAAGGEQRSRDAAQEDAPLDPWTEARQAIRESWPEIADDDEFEDAKAVAKTLLASPAYRGLEGRERYEAVLEAAARAVGLEPAAELDNRRDMRRAGRASVTRHTGMRPALSEVRPTEDQQVTMFGYLQRHPGDIQGARRAAGLA